MEPKDEDEISKWLPWLQETLITQFVGNLILVTNVCINFSQNTECGINAWETISMHFMIVKQHKIIFVTLKGYCFFVCQ